MKSSVAGILDGYGGWHVVVGPRRNMRHHVRPGQLLLNVPNFKIEEPVPWEQIPWMIAKVERYIDWWIATRNDPDTLNCDAVKLYKIRRLRTDHRGSAHLPDVDL